jgi:hypothetical protein
MRVFNFVHLPISSGSVLNQLHNDSKF